MAREQVYNSAPKKSFMDGVIIDKFSKPVVLIFLLLSSLFASYLISTGGLVTALFLLIIVVGLPAVYATIAYPRFGIAVLITASFLINYLSRVTPPDAPIGTVMDAITYMLILGFFIKQQKEKSWDYFKDPISYFVLVWLIYNLMEIINPSAASMLAWVYTVRTVAFLMLMYFVFVFHIRSKEFIKLLLKLWLIMDIIGGLSAFQQENFGFFSFETRWLTSDPLTLKLLFINGHLRKFGIFSDPVVFAFNMVTASMICLSYIISDIKFYKKVILTIMIVFFFTVMLYAGTRASYVIIPAGLMIIAILKFNKRMIVPIIVSLVLFAALVRVPTSNPTLARFQSAFRPSRDASFNERAENQRRIKPYILSHPMGGGLGSVGIWGQRFAPNSYLAKFPPDSGYVRVAVETGWIGLFIYCLLNFIILYQGINYFYLIKDPELKTCCLAMIAVIFAFDIGNYPQQAFVQYPSNILFFLAMAIINVSMRLDLEQRKLNLQTKS